MQYIFSLRNSRIALVDKLIAQQESDAKMRSYIIIAI